MSTSLALPDSAGPGGPAWEAGDVVTALVLAVVTVLAAGHLAARLGRRQLLVLHAAVLLVAAAGCSTAPSGPLRTLSSLLLGAGAGLGLYLGQTPVEPTPGDRVGDPRPGHTSGPRPALQALAVSAPAVVLLFYFLGDQTVAAWARVLTAVAVTPLLIAMGWHVGGPGGAERATRLLQHT